MHLQDPEGLPLSSPSTAPGLANRNQLCLMRLNTTARSSIGTAQPPQPASQNSSDSDSGSTKAMLLLEGTSAAETSHILCYGFTRYHFMLQNGFRDGRLPGHIVNSASVLAFGKSRVISQHTRKSKGLLRKRTPQDCLPKLEKLYIHSLNCSFQRSQQLCSTLHIPLTGKCRVKEKLLITIWHQSFVAP